MNTNTQVFGNQGATTRTHLRRVAWIDQDDTTTGPLCLVRRVLNQLAPRCVCDAFSEAMVGKHPGCVQVLKNDQAVVVGQLPPDLMGEVAAAVGATARVAVLVRAMRASAGGARARLSAAAGARKTLKNRRNSHERIP